jgi:hypothetical protein
MMMGMKIDGRRRLRRMFVRGSKTAYETKKMVSVALYFPVLKPKSLLRPAILAFPMFVRSRNARR